MFLSGYEGNKDDHNFRRREYYPTLERLEIRTEGRPMKPHACRYTFATRGAKSGFSPEALQKLMGHAKYDTTTDFYIQDDVDMLKKAIKSLNNAVANKLSTRLKNKKNPLKSCDSKGLSGGRYRTRIVKVACWRIHFRVKTL